MNSRIVQPAASFQPPETCTEHEECQAAQASHGELCDKALAHYEEVSAAARHWNSLVPRAIEFYKLHGDRASVAAIGLKEHNKHVAAFLSEMAEIYSLDVELGDEMKVADVCAALLKVSREVREKLHSVAAVEGDAQSDPVNTYPTVVESVQLLEAAGFGAPGKPNTLLTMVKEAIAAASSSAPAEPPLFMVVTVSEDCREISIEHPNSAGFDQVFRAHVALRDHLNERITRRQNCPFNPSPAEGEVGKVLTTALRGAEQTVAVLNAVGAAPVEPPLTEWRVCNKCGNKREVANADSFVCRYCFGTESTPLQPTGEQEDSRGNYTDGFRDGWKAHFDTTKADAATPPTPPSDAAMRAAEEIVKEFAACVRKEGFKGGAYQAIESLMDEFDGNGDDSAIESLRFYLLPIITRNLAGTGPTVAGLPICPKCQQGYICEHCGDPIGDYYADIPAAPVVADGDDEGDAPR